MGSVPDWLHRESPPNENDLMTKKSKEDFVLLQATVSGHQA
ncbi:hypothetical protein CCP3SC5AM1_190027 [Gammaproteobacteria bacterium]